jgi:hypothetical protein
MSEAPAPVAPDAVTAGAVENLVTQFSHAFDCVRELVQNSIDAGSPGVEVWTEFQVAEGYVGAACLHVDDFGEGMDEAIIDDQLTTLFASSKEGDLTKIGKFGIGFVSVFALRPRAVLVHSGRGGEYWEVLFHEDRSFSKTRLDTPVEGTQVTLFVEADFQRYREIVDGARAALKKWCCHAEPRLTFEDRSPPAGRPQCNETINEPFVVPGECLTRVEHPGTEIVLAYNHRPIYGLYNRGLALALTDIGRSVFDETRAARYRHVALKLSSRYLEHTLSRESVMRDENYDRAMQLLDAAAGGPLLESLAADLGALVRKPSWDLADIERYGTLLGYLALEPTAALDKLRDRPLLREVHGAACTLDQADDALARDGRVLLAEQPSGLTRRLRAKRVLVLLGRSRRSAEPNDARPLDAVQSLLARLAATRARRDLGNRMRRLVGDLTLGFVQLRERTAPPAFVSDPEDVFLPVVLDKSVPDELRPLLHDASRLLDAAGVGYRRLCTFTADSPVADVPLFLTARRLGGLMARPPAAAPDPAHRLEAAVNREHPHLRRFAALYPQRPALAAYCLAKSLLLVENRMLDRDLELMRAALGEA